MCRCILKQIPETEEGQVYFEARTGGQKRAMSFEASTEWSKTVIVLQRTQEMSKEYCHKGTFAQHYSKALQIQQMTNW